MGDRFDEINKKKAMELHIVKDVVDKMKLSIHPFVPSSIHGWHHTRKKTLPEINNTPPPSAHVLLFRKGMPSPKGFSYQYQTKRAKYTLTCT
jgi:hypothetical protein